MPNDHRWLILRMEAPLLAFGGVAIDHIGVTRDFPAASMLTGLLANALGYRRTDWQKHQHLQDRLIFAVRCERQHLSWKLTDTQNAKLEKSDKAWTTWGVPEGRDGGSLDAPHRRWRDYHMDASVIVVMRLKPEEEAPSLDDIAAALERPARPLFLGRKPCLPAMPLWSRSRGIVTAATAYEALSRVAAIDNITNMRALWPLGEGPSEGAQVHRIIDLPDLRNWRTGLHGGARPIVEGLVMLQPEGTA